MQTVKNVPVIIIGGGITGLSAALFLLQQDIIPLVIERHKTTSVHPRARGFDVRTMELLRELKLGEDIREAGKALAPAWGIHTASSLAKHLKNKKPVKEETLKSPILLKGLEALLSQTPEAGARCTQDLSEPVLLKAIKEQGAEVSFYTELLSFNQDKAGVTVLLRNRETGAEQNIRAGYMIAADGAKSGIREVLGAKTVGKGILANLLNIYFEANLSDFVRGREFSILRIMEPDIKGLLTSINNNDRWVFHLYYDPVKGECPEDFSQERLINILEKVIGIPVQNIRIISVLPWQPTVNVVTEMQHDRIFLAGDAAHTMTPYGGKGANTGVQDVHNLAWKMGYVIKGKATPELLETYSPERQPIGLHYAEESGEMANEYGLIKKVRIKFLWAFLSVVTISFLRLNKVFPRFAMFQLGELLGLPDYQYFSKAIIPEHPSANRIAYTRSGPLSGKAGTRFPHLWVIYHKQQISTLDLLGKDFVLFTNVDNQQWIAATREASKKLNINILVYSIGRQADLVYTGKPVMEIFKMAETNAILVRPDGFVAWRCNEMPLQPAEILEKTLHKIGCR